MRKRAEYLRNFCDQKSERVTSRTKAWKERTQKTTYERQEAARDRDVFLRFRRIQMDMIFRKFRLDFLFLQ